MISPVVSGIAVTMANIERATSSGVPVRRSGARAT